MDWHDFKVLSTYGVLACIVLLIIGQVVLAILALFGYPMYGLIICMKKFLKERKLNATFENVSDNVKQVTICHITKRHPKLKRKLVNKIKKDIMNADYKIEEFSLTDKTQIAPTEADAGFEYYLTFNNANRYHVSSGVYESASIGDKLFIITTPSDTMKVIKSKDEFFNMFTYP